MQSRLDPRRLSKMQLTETLMYVQIDIVLIRTPLTKPIDISEVCTEFNICDRKQLVKYQKNDTRLDKVRSYVIDEHQDTQSYFMYDLDLLYRVHVEPSGEVLHHMFVPQQLRSTMLSLGHDILLAGHIGNKKTRDRIMKHFFWPGIFNDIAEYCRSCPECQMGTAKGRVHRAPLVSIPFQRIALDFVGFLPLSENKNRFILVCVDYATKYPEAIPMKIQDAESVANALIRLSSRVGIPK